jgi:[methyl-Co(III) methanol-specific corrinoid protein]:coenzyme M methyltransferase
MTLLAEAGHTVMGYDVVMPLFSVCHDSAAIGCNVDWGEKSIMPQATKPIWQSDEDVKIPPDFLKHEAAQVPLDSIRQLKKRLGEDAAVCGKVFGPWTLGYHTFGIETWLISTITNPDMIKKSIEKMKQITISFAKAQLEAGADCIVIGDHATRDLCSPDAYREFLKDLHAEFAEEIPCLCILHICGDTSDRIGMIAETGLACFHWDTKLGDAKKARELAGERLSLMGGINNTELLRLGTVQDIEQKCKEALEGKTDIVAPECAVPLDAPVKNLKAVGDYIKHSR